MGKLLTSLFFELQMLLVIIARNTNFLRRHAEGSTAPASAGTATQAAPESSTAPLVCPVCHTSNDLGSKFCGVCGHLLS
ncbi:MAG: zinc-ribbon domain-containing protein [Eggerthellaceae bacterium]